MSKALKKFFNNLGGLNLRSPELLKGDTYATDLRNVEFSENFSITKRKGYQTLLEGVGKCGSTTYNDTDISTGTQVARRLVIDETLRTVDEENVTIIYTGSASAEYAVQLSPVDNNFYLYLFEDGGVSQEINLGTGKESSPVTISDMLAAITGDFSGVATAAETSPAAFIKTSRRKAAGLSTTTVKGTSSPGSFLVFTDGLVPLDTPKKGTIIIDGDEYMYQNWENFASIDQSRFTLTTATTSLYLNGTEVSHTTASALIYKLANVVTSPAGVDPFQDLLDNIDEEDFQPASTVQAHNCVYITSAEAGLWKYDGTKLIKAGLPEPVITSTDEDTGATDKWVYIAEFEYTDAKGNFITSVRSNELTIDSTDTTISIDVSAVEEADGYDVSDTNFKVNLYRTANNGTTFYLLNTKNPVDNVDTNFDQADTPATTLPDADIILNAAYVSPFRDATPPPNCRYIDIWRNQIALTGNPEAVQTVYLANVEDLEGFDQRNSFDTSSRLGGSNSGLKSQDNFLYVFRPHSVSVASGYPDDLTLVVDTLSDEGIGALSHSSLVEANGRIFFTSRRGIYSVSGNSVEYMSDIIQPIFNNINFNEIRCQSFHSLYENKLLFLLPVYNTMGVDKSENYILVYDLISNSWAIWNNMDYTSGMNLAQRETWFMSNEEGEYFYNERLNTDTLLDYADHEAGVSAYYKSHWESLGEPSIPKKFTKLKVFALDTDFRNFGATDFTLSVETNNNFELDTAVTFDMVFGNEGDGWGASSWGEAPWGDTALLTQTSRLQATRLVSIRIVLRNTTTHENILVSGFELEYTAPYVARLRGTR
jgi:hypothetical protein